MMGYTLVRFIGAIFTAYTVAVVVWPLLKCRGRANLLGCVLATGGISLCPALIPPEQIMARAICCLLSIDPIFRVLDYARQVRMGFVSSVTWRAYLTFLIPVPFLLTVFGEKQRSQRPVHFERTDAARLPVNLFIMAMVVFLCLQSHRVALLRESFLLDHLSKLLLFTVFAEAASQVQLVVEHLIGFDAVPIIDHAYLARTPAEFWFRYNQRVRHWLHANVFVPSGGRRSPPTGIVAVFLVSALFHEFFFALATSRLDGYQFAFFMLQAPVVIASPQLKQLAERSAGGRFAARGFTWLWFAVTSLLFFHGLNRVFPFVYASRPWLP
jgi:hypothetical protein